MKCTKFNCSYKGKSSKLPEELKENYDKCPKCDNIQLKKSYHITATFSPKQAYIIRDALETYSRLLMGQIDIALDTALHENWLTYKEREIPMINQNDILPEIISLKNKIYGLRLNESFGIFNEKSTDNGRIAWDIQQVLRNKQSWAENPNGDYTVNYDTPMKSSKEDLPKVKISFDS